MENHVQLMRGEQGCVIRWTIIRTGHAHSWASSEISPFRNGGIEKPSQFINDVGRRWIFSCRMHRRCGALSVMVACLDSHNGNVTNAHGLPGAC